MRVQRFLCYSTSRLFTSSLVGRAFSKRPVLPQKRHSEREQAASFVDFKRVTFKAGNGGNGMVSFFRGFRVPFGGPDGGDGGHEKLIFAFAVRFSTRFLLLCKTFTLADESVKDLSRLASVITGKSGEYGKSKSCHGKSAKHLIVKVPLGTVVKQINTDIVILRYHIVSILRYHIVSRSHQHW
ncbi:unnamed protein product [Toxocara canis]|uniref:Obg domain-containing protein n=1 Tax=Toxocara canis TaxID=6265 RepID=A0A183UJA7_TOXCA|nr:unnamed protein product [Toxocara canis]